MKNKWQRTVFSSPEECLLADLFLFSKRNFNTYQNSSTERPPQKLEFTTINATKLCSKGEEFAHLKSPFPCKGSILTPSKCLEEHWMAAGDMGRVDFSPPTHILSCLWNDEASAPQHGLAVETEMEDGVGVVNWVWLSPSFWFPLSTAYSDLDAHTFLLDSIVGRKTLWNHSLSICNISKIYVQTNIARGYPGLQSE